MSIAEHSDRHNHHRQPRSWHTDYSAPGFVHPPEDCATCGGSGVIDTSPPEVFEAPWLESDVPCGDCAGTGVVS